MLKMSCCGHPVSVIRVSCVVCHALYVVNIYVVHPLDATVFLVWDF